MDTPQANDQAGAAKPASKPSIDSLRTVEFRTTLRGYHMDDVDEYLERVAVEAEGLQEQVRLSSDRLKQAGERVTALEQQLEQARKAQQSAPATELVERVERVEVADDSLQRTLLLAQKFVDQTRQQAEDEANALVTDSEERARVIVADAEEHARVLTEDAERSLRDEVKRLDTLRAELVGDVETIARHLEAERARIRKALTDMVAWVDEHVQPPKSAGSRDGADRKVTPAPGTGRTAGEKSTESPPLRPRPTGQLGSEARQSSAAPAPAQQNPETRREESRDEPGQPTERIQVARGALTDQLDPDDPSDLLDTTAKADASPEPTASSATRSAPGHQRQMFAPGRDSHQAGRGASR
jgi:DivIVA domain-containing protein